MGGDKKHKHEHSDVHEEDGEAPSKKQRIQQAIESEEPQVQKALSEADKVEEEIETENQKQAEEILALETKYEIKKRPLYVKRSAALKKIPGFWKKAIINHPELRFLVEGLDDEALDFLENLDVKHEEDAYGFKLELKFKENPFFSNGSLWKHIAYSKDGEVEVTESGIKWKDSKKAKELAESTSFFEWFKKDSGEVEIANMIKEELWKNPVEHYLKIEEDDCCGEDGECFGEEDDEEQEENDGEEEEDGENEE